MTNEAKSDAENDDRLPKKDPIGVRLALRITEGGLILFTFLFRFHYKIKYIN